MGTATPAGSVEQMSKRRKKKRLMARRKKANHGRKPTAGRR
jgi:hypothetical protein